MTNHIVAIHIILDSALACFKYYLQTKDFEELIEVICVGVDGRGVSVEEKILVSYTKFSDKITIHDKRVTSFKFIGLGLD